MTESHVDNPVRIFLFAVANVICFSVMNLFVKLSADDYSIAQILFFRNALAFIPILYMIWRYGGWALLKTERHGGHFLRGFVGVAAMFCFFASFALLPLADATAIHFAAPLILTALSIPLLGEKVGLHRWGAVVVGLGAVLFMLRPGDGADGHMAGSLIALLAAALAAFAMISVRHLGRTEHALTIVFYFTLYGMVIGGVAMIFMWQPLQAGTVIFLIMTGLLGGVGQIFLTYSYAKAPVAYVAPFAYLSIVFAILFDVLIWAQWPGTHVWGGSLVIMATGLYILYRETKKQRVIARTNLYGVQPGMPTEEDEKEPLP